MMQQAVISAGLSLLLAMIILFLFGHRFKGKYQFLSPFAVALLFCGSRGLQILLTENTPPLISTLAVAFVLAIIVTVTFRQWNLVGHVAFTSMVLAVGTFLIHACYVIVTAELGLWSIIFAVFLMVLQVGALCLLVAHTFEIIDVVCRTRWARNHNPKPNSQCSPKVSLHVPTHNEPPEMVIETLNALAQLDYHDFEVLVIDNNTADEQMWRPIEKHCLQLGKRFRFFHLMPWKGYKAGALNFALSQTDPSAEIIGVVDADYVVQPNYLADLVGYFEDTHVGFVQTPQDYRDADQRGRYGRALYLAYQYFFKISMMTRNEHNAIIYAGTMGLIRRSALLEVGGWDEWCITEDAEVSLRLLDAGYESIFIERSYGHGLMPLDYAGLKKQRFRWAFGGIQLLRLHLKRLINPSRKGNLTLGQRFAYLNGAFQWLNDPLSVLFTIMLLIGSGALVFIGSLFLQPLVGWTILMPPLFILFAVMRLLWAFRIRADCTWKEAFDALTILLGLTWVVTLACIGGFIKSQGTFLRTPKKQSALPSFFDTIRIVKWELVLGGVCLLMAVALFVNQPLEFLSGRTIVMLLLLWQTLIYWSAVRTAVWSYCESHQATPPAWRFTFRTVGHIWGTLVPERRTALWIITTLALLGFLFYIAMATGPFSERIFHADPLQQFLKASSLLPTSSEEEVGGVLVREADAARRADVDAALRLWYSGGIIVDANFTSEASEDDSIWQGTEGLRERYSREFRERHYQALRHENLHITIANGEAIVTNDLSAVIQKDTIIDYVQLPRTDLWKLRVIDGNWQIVRLEVNRAEKKSDAMGRFQ